jgi:hypothetical protein
MKWSLEVRRWKRWLMVPVLAVHLAAGEVDADASGRGAASTVARLDILH